MINELAKLNIAINYSDPTLKLSGSIILDADDWQRILDGLSIAGYELVNKNIILEVKDGKISSR